MAGKSRIDVALVERGLFESRERARRAVMAGQVMVNGQRAEKAGTQIGADAELSVVEQEKFVGRGGLKLDHALDVFKISVAGRECLDIGASTGGFTDCLLQRGAARVVAVDVGHGQLAWKLREDERVVVREGVNARYLDAADFCPPPSIAVADVSFISLTLILPAVFGLMGSEADIVTLIKPQFELGREEVGKGGVVRCPDARLRSVEKIRRFVEDGGHAWLGYCESPITGRDGNVEFLAHFRP